MSSDIGGGLLGDYVELQRGTTYKSALLGQPGPVLLGLSSIARNGGFREDNLRTYGGESPDKLLVRPGELFVSLKDVTQSGDLLGSIARVPNGVECGRLTQDTVRLDLKADDAPTDYLYWLLRSPQYRAYCRAHASGTTNLGLSRDDFLGFPVPPPSEERRAIVRAVQLLEELIDNGRQLERTLDAVIARLFRARFVEFVGEGDLIESPIGQIPAGWTTAPVGDLGRYVNGRAFTKFGTDEGRMVIRIAELRSGPGPSTVYTDHDTEPDYMARPGDLLFAWSGSLDIYRWYRDEALINQHIFKVIPEDYPTWFVFSALKHVMPKFQAIAADKATTMGHIKRGHLQEFAVAIPPQDTLAQHDREFSPLFKKALQVRVGEAALAAARDLLLSGLISGQVRTPIDDTQGLAL